MERRARIPALLISLSLGLAAQTVVNGGRQITGVWDASGAISTRPAKTGTSLPATCAVGEQFFKTDAAPGQNLYVCSPENTWTQVSGGTGGAGSGLPGMTGNAGKVLSNNGSVADWRSLGGDVSGAPEALTVTGIQGRAVGNVEPSDGQVLRWNAAAGRWEPGAVEAAPTGGEYVIDLFPACSSYLTLSTMGQLGWIRGGSNFTFGCGDPVPGTLRAGTKLSSNTSQQMAANLLGFATDWLSPTHSNRWAIEYEFAGGPGYETTGTFSFGLADTTSGNVRLSITHPAAGGYDLCLNAKCFTNVIPWDTARHIVRFERASESLIRARVDGGAWFNWHTEAGSDTANDKYGVGFPADIVRPQVWAYSGESTEKFITIYRFEMRYGY